jgi:hypothetical protein
MIQDRPEPADYVVRRLTGDERTEWFDRGVAVYPSYREYEVSAAGHDREIPVFLATRTS